MSSVARDQLELVVMNKETVSQRHATSRLSSSLMSGDGALRQWTKRGGPSGLRYNDIPHANEEQYQNRECS